MDSTSHTALTVSSRSSGPRFDPARLCSSIEAHDQIRTSGMESRIRVHSRATKFNALQLCSPIWYDRLGGVNCTALEGCSARNSEPRS